MRHEYYGITDSATTVIDRDITVEDHFPHRPNGLDELRPVLSGHVLKFYFIHKPRLDLGLFLGANIHFMKLTMDAEPSGLSVR